MTALPPTAGRRPDEDRVRLEAVRQFADCCQAEKGHSEQVTRLALQLFDSLQSAFSFSRGDRFLLECGAILHDIGWRGGQQGHHKTSLQMILQDVTMPLDESERKIVGLLARYHRKSLPGPDHPLYGGLSEADRRRVDLLAGMIRLADGLDSTHQNAVERIEAQVTARVLTLQCRARIPAWQERSAALEKADLLRRATGWEIDIFCV